MKPELILTGIRGTVFMPQIRFGWELVRQLLVILESYIPCVNHADGPMIYNGQVLNPHEWSLVSPDNKCRLVFSNQKVDLIKEIGNTYSASLISEFSHLCEEIFSIVMNFAQVKSTRFAIAPTFQNQSWQGNLTDFAASVYQVNTFEGARVDNCEFSQVYRIKECIGDTDVEMNYLSKFYTTSGIMPVDGVNQIKEVAMLDIDINSRADLKTLFDVNVIHSFFDQGSVFTDKFLALYFHD